MGCILYFLFFCQSWHMLEMLSLEAGAFYVQVSYTNKLGGVQKPSFLGISRSPVSLLKLTYFTKSFHSFFHLFHSKKSPISPLFTVTFSKFSVLRARKKLVKPPISPKKLPKNFPLTKIIIFLQNFNLYSKFWTNFHSFLTLWSFFSKFSALRATKNFPNSPISQHFH